jgi:endonuclease/exonuclease/phosphatase family metal-dependent hydrolase
MPAARSILAWLLVAPWAAWAIVRVGGWALGFPWVTVIALTPYALPMAVAAGAVAALLRRRGPVAIAAITAVLLAVVLAPRALGGAERSSGTRLQIMTVNMFEGRIEPAAVVALVRERRVDVLCLQELTPEAERALERAGLRRLLPHAIPRPRGGGSGLGIFARERVRELPGSSTSAMTAVLRPPGAPRVQVVAVHAQAPVTRAETDRWRYDLSALPSPQAGGPLRVLAGDFNATLDHRELRDVLDRGYRDAAAVVGAGLRPTWRGASSPWLTIDHVLAPERVAVRALTVHRLAGSDHRAVVATLALPSS